MVWTGLEERRIGGGVVEERGEGDVAEDAELFDSIHLGPFGGLRIGSETMSDAWDEKEARAEGE